MIDTHSFHRPQSSHGINKPPGPCCYGTIFGTTCLGWCSCGIDLRGMSSLCSSESFCWKTGRVQTKFSLSQGSWLTEPEDGTPWKINGWNIIMGVGKMIFLSKWVIYRFQPLIFQGVMEPKYYAFRKWLDTRTAHHLRIWPEFTWQWGAPEKIGDSELGNHHFLRFRAKLGECIMVILELSCSFHGDGMTCFKKITSKGAEGPFPFWSRGYGNCKCGWVSDISDTLHSVDLLQWW